MKKLALFDFDGTITRGDSFSAFICYAIGIPKTVLGAIILSPVMLLYFAKILPNWKTKEIVFTYFFKGWEEERFLAVANDYSKNQLHKIIKDSALEKIRWHKQQEHRIIIISASFENYLAPWCGSKQVELLATKPEFINNKVSGKLASRNCHGEEKIKRLNEIVQIEEYDYIYAYGDSKGDLGLKRIANEFHYRIFH